MPLLAPLVTEQTIWIPNIGNPYTLHDPPNRVLMSEEGTGLPPIQYISQRGPFQHGESLRDYFLQPRIVQLILRDNFCNRTEYWAGRAALLDILRPNRNAVGLLCQGALRKILPDGAIRDLTCVIQQGPNFAPRDPQTWDELAYTEALRFLADDPTYYDPIGHNSSFALLDIGTFPMTFPVVFTGFSFATTINYVGTWISYPTITITGPLTNLTIKNLTTGDTIGFNYVLGAGRTITIDLTYGRKTVTLDDNTNLIGYITAPSALAKFALIPGNNDIAVDGVGATLDTIITFSYFDRYLGI